MKRFVICLISFLVSIDAFAYRECDLTPTRVWFTFATNRVWICFKNAGCIDKTQNENITPDHLNRMYSTAMAAILADKKLRVRYTDDTLSCATLSGYQTDAFEGFWLLK